MSTMYQRGGGGGLPAFLPNRDNINRLASLPPSLNRVGSSPGRQNHAKKERTSATNNSQIGRRSSPSPQPRHEKRFVSTIGLGFSSVAPHNGCGLRWRRRRCLSWRRRLLKYLGNGEWGMEVFKRGRRRIRECREGERQTAVRDRER